MPISLYDLFEEFIGTANTHQGGHVKPNRNFVKWCNTISKDIFNELYEDFEKSQIISDKLTPFLKPVNVVITNLPNQMYDQVSFPADYNYYASAKVLRRNNVSCGIGGLKTIDSKGKKASCTTLDPDEIEQLKAENDDQLSEVTIDKIPQARWSGVCAHRTLKPSVLRPKCTQYEGGLKIAPKRLGVIILEYFRKPKEATFDYTITNPGQENEYIQYNANTSIKLEWDDKMMPDFIARLIKKYGIFNRENSLYQIGKAEE